MSSRLSAAFSALLGREGRLFNKQSLARFYETTYHDENPSLDVQDVPWKAERLHRVCRQAGMARVGSLLEVGCGSGSLLHDMGERLLCPRTVGVDYSGVIARRSRGLASVGIVRADGAELPFRDSAFDLAYFADVLEHVIRPIQFLREVTRVSRRVAGLIPLEAGILSNPMYALRRLRGKRTNLEQYGHIWRWCRISAMSLLRQAGLRLLCLDVVPTPSRYDGMNARGRAVQGVRDQVMRLSPMIAESFFGAATMCVVAEVSQ